MSFEEKQGSLQKYYALDQTKMRILFKLKNAD